MKFRKPFLPLLATILLVFCVPVATAQTIDVTVRSLPPGKAALSLVSGDKFILLDSIPASSPGHFTYALKSPVIRPGLYRLTLDQKRTIDFINDGEDVVIETDASSIRDSFRVVASEGNRLYNRFVRLNRDYKTKSELLQLVIARYPKDDPYYAATTATLSNLQGEYYAFIASASKEKPGSFAARYIRSSQLPIVDVSVPPEQQLDYLKAHALDSVDYADEDLVRSDLFAAKSIEYLTYFRNPQMPKELLEKEFMKAVDSILTRARLNEVVYKQVTEYLLDGFRKFGFEPVIDYILDRYVVKDDLCLDEGSGTAIGKMIEQKKLFVPGTVLPAIALPDSAGRTVDLKALPAERFLVVFYSAGCPHCRTMIPKLKELYAARKSRETEVIAVGLESSRKEWLDFVREQRPGWRSVSDLLGWNSPLVEGYRIYATPTMVVLDREMRLIAAPRTVEEAKEWL
jgi:thiol-disulfide isomerase/thioredoxin